MPTDRNARAQAGPGSHAGADHTLAAQRSTLAANVAKRLGEPIDVADLDYAFRVLEYTRKYEPGRVLDDPRSKWMRVIRACGELGCDVSTDPARDRGAT
jgi:hypothetical protein